VLFKCQHGGDACAIGIVRVEPPSGQTCPSTMLLEVLSRPFSLGVVRVGDNGVIFHQWVSLFSFLLLFSLLS